MATLDLDEEPEFQTDLRPCPFCKGKVKLMKYIDHYYIRYNFDFRYLHSYSYVNPFKILFFFYF